MADAPVMEAPSKKEGIKKQPEYKVIEGWDEKVEVDSNEYYALTQKFDTEKKYMFELATENPQREFPVMEVQGRVARISPHKRFKPSQNIILSSQIIWNGQRRTIRYYDGCVTLFVDKQPKEKETIDQFIQQTRKRHFLEGKFGVYGYDRMLLIFMNICSWNIDSKFRTRTADVIFRTVNADKIADETSNRIDKIEKALKLAREASEQKMLIHAKYLEIPTHDWDSDSELTPKEIRALYRQEASNNPDYFIETYGNKAIELKYFIEKALESGIINTKFNPNKAVWKGSNTEICDISGLTSHEAITQKLFEFSQREDGEEFVIQLKALSE